MYLVTLSLSQVTRIRHHRQTTPLRQQDDFELRASTSLHGWSSVTLGGSGSLVVKVTDEWPAVDGSLFLGIWPEIQSSISYQKVFDVELDFRWNSQSIE
ncbi:hypothetical protein TNCV_4871741 [Trichonephila clavipes]|nr:hypothetical protein TNCV_4871741 [Trichonephila clavipes]